MTGKGLLLQVLFEGEAKRVSAQETGPWRNVNKALLPLIRAAVGKGRDKGLRLDWVPT